LLPWPQDGLVYQRDITLVNRSRLSVQGSSVNRPGKCMASGAYGHLG
jgi:hypothetical protein